MKQLFRIFFLTILLTGANVMANADDTNKDAVRVQMQTWIDAFNNKDIDALMSIYSDEIYYANNGSPLERSIESIRKNYAAGFEAAPGVTIDFNEELVSTGETLAHIAGKYRVNIPAADGSTQHRYGRVLLIFEKQDGAWKMVVDFDNQGSDLSDATF